MKPIPATKAIDLYTGLLKARRTQLHPALNAAVTAVGVEALNLDLQRLVPAEALTHLASLGLRGERVFPTPVILQHAPVLIGYYRMLLGLSRKQFAQGNRLGYGSWVGAEQRGRLSAPQLASLDDFCRALISPLVELVNAMGQFTDRDLSDLALLTLGPTLQGARNTVIGEEAALQAFQALRTVIPGVVLLEGEGVVRFQADSGRTYEVIAAADPDISVREGLGDNTSPLIAIEVKGGQDLSNAHNRAGEAEKSQIAAELQGYPHRWTVIHMAGIGLHRMQTHSPHSTEIFNAADVLGQSGPDWVRFQERFRELVI
jgi:hypothetical protein